MRELYNALYRACSLAKNNELAIGDLNLSEQEILPVNVDQFAGETLEQIMNKFESMVLQKFYEQYPSSRVGSPFRMSHTAIANKLKQYGIVK